VTCKTVTAHGKQKQQCTTKVVSGVVKFKNGAADRATLSRGRVVFATGTSVSMGHGRTQLLLRYRRVLRPGRYTLTIKSRYGRGWRTSRQTITIGGK
jgi:hypothetical protein